MRTGLARGHPPNSWRNRWCGRAVCDEVVGECDTIVPGTVLTRSGASAQERERALEVVLAYGDDGGRLLRSRVGCGVGRADVDARARELLDRLGERARPVLQLHEQHLLG